MTSIKKLYAYILKMFLPMFLMTFVICMFLVLMQFLWKYIEDLVGKGLDILTLGKLFTYAGLNLMPLALPLAILLASLITFGNLGENFELTAIKASGVSLFKTMKPLIFFIIFVCIGAFFFQNNAVPRINVRFRALLQSINEKSPELDIPEGSFYNAIPKYSLFVKQKGKDGKLLKGVMIYDTSRGFDNMAVIVCDSARMKISSHKDYLMFDLYSGQSFSNFKQSGQGNYYNQKNEFTPYSREDFKKKEIIVSFDSNLNQVKDSPDDNAQISKNISQLGTTIDSMNVLINKMNQMDHKFILQNYLPYQITAQSKMGIHYTAGVNATNISARNNITAQTKKTVSLDFDSVMNHYDLHDRSEIYRTALSQVSSNNSEYTFQSMRKVTAIRKRRAHEVEWHRKFTLSFACLIFFFIGAPLGAIIRKGGLGVPVVTSVALFITYYILDNVGVKMARDGVWSAWRGVWFSSIILFPLGVFLTYQAMNDSALLNSDGIRKILNKIFDGDRYPHFYKSLYQKIKGYNQNRKTENK